MREKELVLAALLKPRLLHLARKLGIAAVTRDLVEDVCDWIRSRASLETILDALRGGDLRTILGRLGAPTAGRTDELRARLRRLVRDPHARWMAERVLFGEDEEDDGDDDDEDDGDDDENNDADNDAEDEGENVDEEEEFDEEPADEGRSSPASGLDRDERLTLDLAEIDWPATLQEVRVARRRLAALYHPDRHHGSEALMKLMQRWNGACDRLERRLGGA